jgi:hypothetical protein
MLRRVTLHGSDTNTQSNASGIIASAVREVKGIVHKSESAYKNKEDIADNR